ncbi:MAG: hypothetical protein JKY37_29095 [Nannocystaceae bacterium]|nr:hypothetical protein [Nannocystaceae bacterium]
MNPTNRFRLVCLGISAAVLGITACDSGGPTIAESLAAKPEEKLDYKPNPKPRPTGLAGPTDAEFKAWDRKDVEGEKHLYKFDKKALPRMIGYWEEIECFREKVKQEGKKAFGVEPGSPQEEEWFQFKQFYVHHVNGWQQRLFAKEPGIQSKSLFIGKFIEAHELVMHGYPKAYNMSDETELEKADIYWAVVENKLVNYARDLGEEWPIRDPADEKAAAKHAEVCVAALTPPDRSGKAKKKKRKR